HLAHSRPGSPGGAGWTGDPPPGRRRAGSAPPRAREDRGTLKRTYAPGVAALKGAGHNATPSPSDLAAIECILGDDAESLLPHECTTIPTERLHLPGPDFLDR